MLSRPLLVLSIATAFSDQLECTNETSDGDNGSHGNNDSQECSEPEPHAGPSSSQSTPDTRYVKGWSFQASYYTVLTYLVLQRKSTD